MTDETDDCRYIEQQVAGALLLTDLTVDTSLQQQIVVIKSADDCWAERSKRVASLAAEPLHVVILPVTFADVIAARHTKDAIRRIGLRDAACFFANNDNHFAFVMYVFSARWKDDLVLRADHAGRQLEKYSRLCGRRFSV